MNSSTRDSCGELVARSRLSPREKARSRARPRSDTPKSGERQESRRSGKGKAVDIQRLRSNMEVDDAKESTHKASSDSEGSSRIQPEESESDMPRNSRRSETEQVHDTDENQHSASGFQDEDSLRGSLDNEDELPEGSERENDDISSSEDISQKQEQGDETLETKQKKRTAGIVYLSYIPEGLNVAKTRELLGEFGEVKRMYFEPVKKLGAKNRPLHRFREGWVEFAKKKDAKRVAELLNAKPVGGKRRAPYRDCLWSIKYLHRFRWTHLAERLTYEKAVKDQRMRTEIAKAKREAKFYAKTLEQSIRRRKNRQNGEVPEDNPSRIKLRKTDKEIREEKGAPAANEVVDKSLLMSIFAKD